MSRFPRLLAFFPAWLVFVFYLPTLLHGYVWDDTYFITDMPYLRDPALWWRHIQEPLFVSTNYFRPLPLLMFVAEARLGDLNAFIFHLVNVLLHALNTTLVMLLARAFLPQAQRWLAVAAALFFGLHPALVESASWISDRFDLLMMSCILLILCSEHYIKRRLLRIATLSVLFVLALLSKETSIIVFVLLPLWQLIRLIQQLPINTVRPWTAIWQSLTIASERRYYLTLYASLVAVVLAYLCLRYQALGFLYQRDTQMAAGSLLQHALLIGKTLGWYGLLLLLPFTLVGPVHPAVTPVALGDVSAWLGLVFVLIFGVLLIWGVWRARVIALLGFAALVALSPVSNLLPLTIGDNLVHDRYLMLPIFFAALALAIWFSQLNAGLLQRWSGVVGGVWLLCASVTVMLLVPRWESNVSLWSWAYAHHPDSQIARDNYQCALSATSRNEDLLNLSRQVLTNDPTSVNSRHHLALALARLGRYVEAEVEIRQVIANVGARNAKVRMDASEAWNLLAYIHMQQQRWQAAESDLHQAIALSPYLTRPHYNLALVLYERGEWAAGDEALAFAIHYAEPTLAAAFQRLGNEKKLELQAKRAVRTSSADKQALISTPLRRGTF